jgi:hypothetical protein
MSKSKPLLPLTLAVFHMLLALFSKERHGDVMQQVKSDSEDAVKTDPCTCLRYTRFPKTQGPTIPVKKCREDPGISRYDSFALATPRTNIYRT